MRKTMLDLQDAVLRRYFSTYNLVVPQNVANPLTLSRRVLVAERSIVLKEICRVQ